MIDVALQALAEPRRRAILALVRERELPAGEIARRFDVTRPAISQHLAVLRDAGLVTERRDGTRRLYRARPAGTADLRDWLADFWDGGLDRLRHAAEQHDATNEPGGSTMTDDATLATGVIEREVRIAAPPETVFAFWVEPERIRQWMGRTVTMEPRPGGAFQIDYNGSDIASGEVLEIDPPRRLVLSWGWEAEGDATPPGASRVEVTLSPDGDGTLLRLRHSGLVEAAVEGHAVGWDQFLPGLVTVAEGTSGG